MPTSSPTISNDDTVESVLDSCLPEPSEWRQDRDIGKPLLVTRHISDDTGVWVGFLPNGDRARLSAADAIQMAKSLIEHADYARSQSPAEGTAELQ